VIHRPAFLGFALTFAAVTSSLGLVTSRRTSLLPLAAASTVELPRSSGVNQATDSSNALRHLAEVALGRRSRPMSVSCPTRPRPCKTRLFTRGGAAADEEEENPMSTTQWILNCTLLGWVLMRNLGTHPVTKSTYLAPLAVVAVAAAVFLRHLPTVGHDVTLEMVGAAAGVAFGVLSTVLTRIHITTAGVMIRAGVAFATLWVVVIGGRIAFAEWANGPGGRTIGEFSMRHQITGADAWTAAFVLMALAMVAGRLASTALWIKMRRPEHETSAPVTVQA
jgi:hypothetical protein